MNFQVVHYIHSCSAVPHFQERPGFLFSPKRNPRRGLFWPLTFLRYFDRESEANANRSQRARF